MSAEEPAHSPRRGSLGGPRPLKRLTESVSTDSEGAYGVCRQRTVGGAADTCRENSLTVVIEIGSVALTRGAMTTTAAEMVAQAKAKVENLSAEQTAQELKGGALLVDIREASERSETGFVEGSIEAPRGMLEFWADPTSPYHREEFDPNRRIILHCASGGRSALAAATLSELGFTNIAHLDGGLKAWKESGLPVQTL